MFYAGDIVTPITHIGSTYVPGRPFRVARSNETFVFLELPDGDITSGWFHSRFRLHESGDGLSGLRREVSALRDMGYTVEVKVTKMVTQETVL